MLKQKKLFFMAFIMFRSPFSRLFSVSSERIAFPLITILYHLRILRVNPIPLPKAGENPIFQLTNHRRQSLHE